MNIPAASVTHHTRPDRRVPTKVERCQCSAQAIFEALRAEGIHKSYTMAFSLRCGSTILSETLTRLGCGRPTEYFQYPYKGKPHFAPPHADLGAQLLNLVRLNAQSGIFGSKMTHDHRAHLEGHLSSLTGESLPIDRILPNHSWLYMQRRNEIAQAISWHVAETTDTWHLLNTEENVPRTLKIPYDFFSILSKVMILGANRANWEAYFSKNNIRPYRLYFEDLVANPNAVISNLLAHLEFTPKHGPIQLSNQSAPISISRAYGDSYNTITHRFTEDFLRLGQTDDTARLGPATEKWNRFFSERQWQL